MAATTSIPLQQYLQTDYSPDCDYVDGELQERNGDEYDHSSLQFLLLRLLYEAGRASSLRVKPELRIRISPTRYRVPDILVMRKSQPREPVLTQPPFLCIEILSPEDRMTRMAEKVKDYLAFGVEYIWVIDPRTETAWLHTATEAREVHDELRTSNPEIFISLRKLFEELKTDES